jgi:hypothetical protein
MGDRSWETDHGRQIDERRFLVDSSHDVDADLYHSGPSQIMGQSIDLLSCHMSGLIIRSYSVMVSTQESDSCIPSSNLGRTSFVVVVFLVKGNRAMDRAVSEQGGE